MKGATGSALQWALVLLRTPGERYTLRRMSLPDGVQDVLAIAAGVAPATLAAAAEAFGEPEGRVLQASRFYVREVMFSPDADAYRVLGVAPHASAQQIRANYKLLQHWLHPDRADARDDAVFAARVNTAWNQLRNANRRNAYDASREAGDALEMQPEKRTHGVPAWIPDPEAQSDRWRRRMLPLLLLLACVVLAVLVLRDLSKRPETADQPVESTADAQGAFTLAVPKRSTTTTAAPAIGIASDAKKAVLATKAGIEVRQPPILPPEIPAEPEAQAFNLPDGGSLASVATGQALEVGARGVPQPGDAPDSRVVAPIGDPMRRAAGALAVRSAAAKDAETPGSSAWTVVPQASRRKSAQRTGEQFIAYMQGESVVPPPIWNSPMIMASAEQLRGELTSEGETAFAKGAWRFGHETAVLTSTVTFSELVDTAGVVTVDMIWREERWLVTGFSLERPQ